MSQPEIKEGDWWVFTTNRGGLGRIITLIGSTDVAYLTPHGKERVCKIDTFQRWAKGAELEYRIPDDTEGK